MAKTNAAFMSGVPELLILRLLAQREMYGYELVRAIRLASDEAIILAEGVVYPLLHSLENKKLLKASEKVVNGRARIYYQVTPKGARRLETLDQQWQDVSSGIEKVLRGYCHA